jgi:hypothetical protein
MSAWVVVFDRLTGATTAGNRIYPLLLPQNPEYPNITFQQISTVRMHAMQEDAPLLRVRMQIDIRGKTYADAKMLAGQVEGLLSRFRGEIGGQEVQDILLDNEMDLYETEQETRRVSQDYTIFLTTTD